MLHDLVAECASRYPDEVCLIFDSANGDADSQQRITYSQLWQQAMELKSAFDSLAIREQIVGVLLVDGISVPSVLLGILSSSCAFHPFNTEGLHYTCKALRKAGASWILAHSELSQQLKPLLTQLEGIEVPSANLSNHGLQLYKIVPSSVSALTSVQQFHLAYSITTSGTTSAPKVVLVPHSCIVPNIIDLRNIFHLSIGDRVLLTSPLTFDPSIIDIFCTLSSGACLVIVPAEVKRRPEKLLDIIHFRQEITVMQATPTLIRSFSPSKLQETILGPGTALRVLALGGEQFPSRATLVGWLHADNKKTQFYNLYGVTEVSCWASCQSVDVRAVLEKEEQVSLGEALSETVIKLAVDEVLAETPCSDDEGDIWIGSQSRICLIDDEVCEHVEKDWNSQVTQREQTVWRNTGDRGKLLQDGRILCLGRRDDQVKRHGKRLSLEALEMVCKEVTGIIDCTAVLDKTNLMVFIIPDSFIDCHLTEPADNTSAASTIDDRLVGHQSPNEGSFSVSTHDTGWSLLQQRLSAHIEDSLPSHYMPTSFVKIAGRFPLTQNGKLDKKQLLNTGYGELKAGMEVKDGWHLSQQVWRVNLPDPPVVIQETSNFVSLGGESLAAVRVVNQLENLFSCSLPVLLDVLVNKNFQQFVEELQRCANLRLSDTSWTQIPCTAGRHSGDSLVSSIVTSDNYTEEKTVNRREQDVHSLGVYNKKLQPEKHKHTLPDVWTGSKIAKLAHISTPSEALVNSHPMSAEWTGSKPAKRTHISTPSEALVSSHPLSAELHGDCQFLENTYINTSSKSQEMLGSHKGSLEVNSNAKEGHAVSKLPVETCTNGSSKVQVKLGSGKDHPGLSCDVDVAVDRHEDLILPLGTCSRSSSKYQMEPQNRQDNREISIDVDTTTEGHTDHALPSGTCLGNSHKHHGRQDSRHASLESGSAADNAAGRQVFSHLPIRIISRGLTRQKDLLHTEQSIEQSKRSTAEANICVYSGSHDDAMESDTAGANSTTNTWKPALGLTLRWKFDTKKCVDASPLVVEQGGGILVFIGSHSGQFTAINILAGSCLWSVTLPDRIESSACCSLCGSYVVVGCYDGMLYVINATSGLIVWKFQTGDMVKCSPVVDDHTGYVICGSHDGYLYCLDVKEQLCVWKCHLGGGSVFSSPTIDTSARLVYAASLAGKVLGICADSGTVRWICELQKPVFSSLCLLGHSILTACVDGKLYCLNSLGQVEWTFSTQASVFSTPVVQQSSIILGSHDHRVYCLTDSGHQTWTFQASSPVFATAFPSILTRSTENDQSPDLLFGSSILKQSLNHVWKQSVVVTAETKGVLYVLSYRDGQVRGEVRLPGEIFSSPVVVDHFIVVGCRDNFVYCFEMT